MDACRIPVLKTASQVASNEFQVHSPRLRLLRAVLFFLAKGCTCTVMMSRPRFQDTFARPLKMIRLKPEFFNMLISSTVASCRPETRLRVYAWQQGFVPLSVACQGIILVLQPSFARHLSYSASPQLRQILLYIYGCLRYFSI